MYEEQLKQLDEDARLRELEETLSRFNIFEAIGVTTHEIRHSNFLAFLLAPQQKHGLGDAFIRRLLKHVWANAQPQEVEDWDRDQIEVRREWQDIDIFILNKKRQVTVTIENKVDSSQGDVQLETYRKRVKKEYPTELWRNLFVYLTRPGSELPKDSPYIHIHYGTIINWLEDILAESRTTPCADSDILIRHYIALLRKLGMDQSLVDLCNQVYQKHSQAIDFILRVRTNLLKDISEWLKKSVSLGALDRDESTRDYIRFYVREWDSLIPKESNWTSSKRILLFVFNNWPQQLELALYIGPGPADLRQNLKQLAGKSPFLDSAEKEGKWLKVYQRPFLVEKDYQVLDLADPQNKLAEEWEEFQSDDLPQIISAVRSQLAAKPLTGFPHSRE